MGKVSKEELNDIIQTADMQLSGNYRSIYESLGAEKGSGSNYKCFNKGFHTNDDGNPSMGISNETGQYHCFACGTKGNLLTFWNDFYHDNQNEYYHEFLQNALGVKVGGKGNEIDTAKLNSVYDAYTKKKKVVEDEDVEVMVIPDSDVEEYTNNLLEMPGAMAFLKATRNVSKDDIVKYRLGFTYDFKVNGRKTQSIMFPQILPDGKVVNYKMYQPHLEKKDKWRHMHRNRVKIPTPIQNFAQDTLYFFEGEPDTYCAIGFGVSGAVTFGSASATNPAEVLGEEQAKKYLSGKEVVICFDADKAGIKGAKELAVNIYEYVRQVKIIDLSKSEDNKYGIEEGVLYDELAKEDGIPRPGNDFTDFMKINGFEKMAIDRFNSLVKNTPAFTDHRNRSDTELYKVTVQESRMPKYHSEYGGVTKRLRLIASVSDMDNSAYMYNDRQPIECHMMAGGQLKKKCENCSLPLVDGFDDGLVVMELMRASKPEHKNDLRFPKVTEKDILELIEVSEAKRKAKLKQICGVNPSCQNVVFREGRTAKITHVKLMKDVSTHTHINLEKDKEKEVTLNDIDVDAYILGSIDVQGGKSYLMEGVQTISPEGQYAALFIDNVEPIQTSIEQFTMSGDLDKEMATFKPKEDESIEDALGRRYSEYLIDAKITGRPEIMLMYDLAIMSSTDFNSSMISETVRKWVEVGVVGESRTGKSVVAKFLFNKYRVGEYLDCSSSVSRTGVLGGISKQMKGRDKISWGLIPRNDRSVVIMDEADKMGVSILTDMTASRSSGIVDIKMAVSGKALARTRKIFISNKRADQDTSGQQFEGMYLIKDVYKREEIIQRFDLMYFVKSGDVNFDTFKNHYVKSTNDFTDLQCSHLLMWAYSRKPDDFIFEGGEEEFNEYVGVEAKKLHDLFHEKTLLVGQESNVRIVRLSVALASLLYSTVEDDYTKVLVKKEHATFIVDFMIKLYTHPNMRFHEFSAQERAKEQLGDMRFMENILRYVSPTSIIRETSFTDRSIQQIFLDYLVRVSSRDMFMVDASNDERSQTGLHIMVSTQKLIQTMVVRNCLRRGKNGQYNKSPMFTSWLNDIKERDPDEFSTILEYDRDKKQAEHDQQASNLIAKYKKAE